MATFELPQIPAPRITSNLLLGAASPLWSYFGAATAGGVAWWWMTRWTQAQNLEALFGRAAQVLPEAAVELAQPAVDVAEAIFTAAEEIVEAAAPDLPTEPTGGEAAPISPMLEVLHDTARVEPSAPGAVDADSTKPRVRKSPTPNGSDAQA